MAISPDSSAGRGCALDRWIPSRHLDTYYGALAIVAALFTGVCLVVGAAVLLTAIGGLF